MADNYEFTEAHLGFKLPIKLFGEKLDAIIIGINHDKKDDDTKANVTWFVSTPFVSSMNLINSNVGEWRNSYMWNVTLPYILKELENKNNIKITPVIKYNYNDWHTNDKLFLLSLNEYKEFKDLNEYNQLEDSRNNVYELFKKEGFTQFINVTNRSWHYTRSPRSSNSSHFCGVYSSGSWSCSYASNSGGVSFAFSQ